MTVFYFNQPALQSWFLFFFAQQQFRGISPLDILQHFQPFLHVRYRVRRQVVGFSAVVYFKSGGSLGTCYSAGLVHYNFSGGFLVLINVILKLPKLKLPSKNLFTKVWQSKFNLTEESRTCDFQYVKTPFRKTNHLFRHVFNFPPNLVR